MQTQQAEVPESLLTRISAYPVVSSTLSGLAANYNYVKDYSPLLKYGLETGEQVVETTAQTVVPIVAPIYNSTVSPIVEAQGHLALDRIEDQVAAATDYLEKAQRAVNETQQNIANKTEQLSKAANDAAEFILDQKLQLQSGETVEKLLDMTENLLDNLLPPNFESDEVQTDQSKTDEEKTDQAKTDKADKDAHVKPPNNKERAVSLGYKLPGRVRDFAKIKVDSWKTLNFRTEQQMESFTHVVDLMQYAAEYIDLDGAKQKLDTAVEHAKRDVTEGVNFISTGSDKIKTAVSSEVVDKIGTTRRIIEKYTEDVTHKGTQLCIGVVAAVAHATELTRRQLIAHTNMENLQEELVSYVLSSKKAILALNKEDLAAYIEQTKITALKSLRTAIHILHSYTPAFILSNLDNMAHLHPTLAKLQQLLNSKVLSQPLTLAEAKKDLGLDETPTPKPTSEEQTPEATPEHTPEPESFVDERTFAEVVKEVPHQETDDQKPEEHH